MMRVRPVALRAQLSNEKRAAAWVIRSGIHRPPTDS
jgi:hypothetical protein